MYLAKESRGAEVVSNGQDISRLKLIYHYGHVLDGG
jgi:hypothetical protein